MSINIDKSESDLFYVEESKIHGKGLFARNEIKKGTYIGEYLGPETSENGMHVLWTEDEEGNWLGRDGENSLRYLNHNTKPCAEFDDYELFAVKNIKPNQEITIDYGEEP